MFFFSLWLVIFRSLLSKFNNYLPRSGAMCTTLHRHPDEQLLLIYAKKWIWPALKALFHPNWAKKSRAILFCQEVNIKGNLHFISNWRKILEIKPKFQLFKLASGEKVLTYQKIGHEYRLFLLLNFPRAAILNFYDVLGLPILLHTKESCFWTIVATIWRYQNSKWLCAGNSKAKIGDLHI